MPSAPITFSGSVYFGTSNGQRAPSKRRTQLSHIPIVRRSRNTMGISIPETVGRTRWAVTPKRNIVLSSDNDDVDGQEGIAAPGP